MEPAPQTLGPYRLLETLGRGGMGVVYRAQDQRSGEWAAVKTVRVPKESLVASIRREIHALARLRHPGVVRVAAEGVESGLPWYAMELLEGRTLRQYCSGLWTGEPDQAPETKPETPETRPLADETNAQERGAASGVLQVESAPGLDPSRPAEAQPRARLLPPAAGGALAPVLGLVRRLCAPLAFLHGEGIVHRDLKPDNVIVRPDGQPVLFDFGLVSKFEGELGREALDLVGAAAAGTVAYMAPEQIKGEFLDARADLYALGCMLYELVTGRQPFLGFNAAQIVWGHLQVAPKPPSELVEGMPPELDALILRLLAKRPPDRLGHADDVAAALASLGAAGRDTAEIGPKPRSYLYRPGFAGRQEVLEELRARLDAESGGLVLVGGESGVGKTRLAMELAREAARRGMPVLGGECLAWAPAQRGSAQGDGGALHPLRRPLQAVADRCRELGVEETDRLLGPRGKVLALYEPALSALPGQEAYPEPVELPAEAARARLFDGLARTLGAFGPDRLLLLVLDDLQWADELTLGFLESALRRRQLERVLVVGTYRSEEVAQAGQPQLQALVEYGLAQALELGRFGLPEVGSMVGDMLALAAPPTGFVRFLSRQSEGNPFFVAELLRTAVSENLLYRSEGRWHVAAPAEPKAETALYEALPLPRSLRELLGRRLEALSATARALAEAGSVLGREAELSLLAEVSGLDGATLMEAVTELLNRHVLEEPKPGLLRFTHDKLRETAYEQMGERRRELHHTAAEAIEGRLGPEPGEHIAALARHWEEAGVAQKARPYYLASARRSMSRYALAEAERLYRAYLRLAAAPTPESVAARNELAFDVLYFQGRAREAIEVQHLALEEARKLSDRAGEAQALTGLAALDQNDVPKARSLLLQALELYRALGDRRSEGRLLGNLAMLETNQDRFEEARALYIEALAIHRESGNRKFEGIVLYSFGASLYKQSQLGAARDLYQEALAIHREVGARSEEGVTLMFLANLLSDQGHLSEALVLYEQALAVHREIGDLKSEGATLCNLATLLAAQGRVEEARGPQEQALAIHRETGDLSTEGVNLSLSAHLHQETGRIDEARTLHGHALEIHRKVGARQYEGVTLYRWARLERRANDMEKAELLLEQAERILLEIGARSQLAFCLCERGHLALARGLPARDLLEAASEQAERLQAGPSSELGRQAGGLRRAVEAFEAGRPLHRGECVEDLPEALRNLSAEASQLPAGPPGSPPV